MSKLETGYEIVKTTASMPFGLVIFIILISTLLFCIFVYGLLSILWRGSIYFIKWLLCLPFKFFGCCDSEEHHKAKKKVKRKKPIQQEEDGDEGMITEDLERGENCC